MQVAVKNKQILQELINKNKNTLSKFYNLDPDRLFDKSIVYC